MQAKLNQMIIDEKPGLICEYSRSMWDNLQIPENQRGQWNIAREGINSSIHLVDRRLYTMIPSTQMGDIVESSEGWIVGSITKYSC